MNVGWIIDFNYHILVNDEKLKGIVLFNRGTIKYRMGCKDDALKDLENALQSDPDNEEFKEAVTKCKESK